MAKITDNYEVMFIINATISEEDTAAIVEKFKALIEANGTLNELQEIGKQRLAYRIDDMPEGYYVLVEFDSKPDFPAELDRIYKITDGIIRSIIVAKE